MDPYKSHEVYFDFKNSYFLKSLTKKHHTMKDKRIILFMKHVYLKKLVNLFQISIIFASTIIGFFESMKPHLFPVAPDRQNKIVSVCLSTYIAISTAIFKFIKIDDRKEEIYKILQVFNDIETLLNCKIKQVHMIHSNFEDEIAYFNKNHIYQEEQEQENTIIQYQDQDQDQDEHEDEGDEEMNAITRKKIMHKYFTQFEEIIQSYEQEEIEKKIVDAKKQFHTMFSYNEIIYYKGKIVESLLLDRVHVGNRTMLEAPLDEYKNHYHLIKMYKRQKELSDVSGAMLDIEEHISRLKQSSKQVYNEDDIVYTSSCFNNLCLYFSNICHFCLVMNLYLNLAIKRSKFRSLKKQLESEDNEILETTEFLCCRCKAFDQFVEWGGCQGVCCCSSKENQTTEQVYYCCDC